jgi:hypothetical protein
VIGAPAGARAQVFLASRPSPDFAIGPLFVRTSIGPGLGPVAVDILWGLVIPPTRSAVGMEQDLYLLWPGSVVVDRDVGPADPGLAAYVIARGFTVLAEGRLRLFEQNLYPIGADTQPQPIKSGAPFVTFGRQGLRPLGLTSAATYVRIPWTPKLVNPTWLVGLSMTVDGLLKPEKAGWLQNMFWGRRYRLSIGFNDVRDQTLAPMYFEHRDRAVRLANEPSQLLVNFSDLDRLRIDEVFPPATSRRPSESTPNSEVVSYFLDSSEGRIPQVLTVRFGYISGLQTWAPILIPVLFFVLGRATGPLIERMAREIGSTLAARVHVGWLDAGPRARDEGVILTGEVLAGIVPGETTYDDVVRLCGREVEEQEDLGSPGRRTLIYRGRRIVPQPRRRFAWLATVSHWDLESHEVEIQFDRDRVRNVQQRLRRARSATPAG